MKHLMIILSVLFASVLQAQTCESEAQYLQADYEITPVQGKPASHLTLLRAGNWVAHRYADNHITESWYLVKPQLIKATRYFEQHQRAIEYAPGEVVHGKRETDWDYRNQLITDSLLKNMTKTATRGEGCEREEVYVRQENGKSLTIHWRPALSLLTQFELKQGERVEHWTLTGLSMNKAQIMAIKQQLDDYQSTDYADIGDDHSDPFLTNMVHQGFIEHGHSGFYEAETEHTH